MSHYDNLRTRMSGIVNLSSAAISLITEDILRNAQYSVIKELSDDLYTEYKLVIVNTLPIDKMYSEFTTNELKLWHYEMATSYYAIINMISKLKKLEKDSVMLDRLSVGSGDLYPSDISDNYSAIKYYESKALIELSEATDGYVNAGDISLVVI